MAVKQLEFRKGALIYSCGAPAEGVYLVSKGSVSLTLTDARGHERIVQFVRAGELFGLEAMSAEESRLTGAEARERVKVCVAARAASAPLSGFCVSGAKGAMGIRLVAPSLMGVHTRRAVAAD